MRRGMTSLIVILVLQLALALLLFTRHDPLAGVTSDTRLLPPDAVKNADQLVIDSKPAAGGSTQSARIELLKKNGTWILPGSFDAPAESFKVNALLDRLAALKRGLPIATSEGALRRFKVVDTDFERRLVLSAGGKAVGTVYFGSSPGLRKSDARTSTDKAVYAVDLPTYELPTDAGAWLNADLLRTDTDKLAELDVSSAAPGNGASKASSGAASETDKPIQLVRSKGTDKQPDAWTDPALTGDRHIDNAHVEALVQQLAQLHVEAVLGTAAAPDWQQDHPLLRLTLKNEQAHSVDWALSKPASGDFYVLKSSSQPWFFSISINLGQQLLDAAGADALIGLAKVPAKVPAPSRAKAPGKT
jgi:hypothetical protein